PVRARGGPLMLRGVFVLRISQTLLFAGLPPLGALLGIAPPEEPGARLALAAGASLSLTLLWAAAAALTDRALPHRRVLWSAAAGLLLGAALLAALRYRADSDALLIPYPPESREARHVVGTTLTAPAARYLAAHPDRSRAELLADFGGLPNRH